MPRIMLLEDDATFRDPAQCHPSRRPRSPGRALRGGGPDPGFEQPAARMSAMPMPAARARRRPAVLPDVPSAALTA